MVGTNSETNMPYSDCRQMTHIRKHKLNSIGDLCVHRRSSVSIVSDLRIESPFVERTDDLPQDEEYFVPSPQVSYVDNFNHEIVDSTTVTKIRLVMGF